MTTNKTERIEIDLPEDIIFAMRGLEKPEGIKKRLKKNQQMQDIFIFVSI